MPRKGRPKHAAEARLHVPRLSKAGTSLSLTIRADRTKLGEVTIGRGAIFWVGRKRKSSKRLSWTRFAEKMDELAYGPRRRRRPGK